VLNRIEVDRSGLRRKEDCCLSRKNGGEGSGFKKSDHRKNKVQKDWPKRSMPKHSKRKGEVSYSGAKEKRCALPKKGIKRAMEVGEG